MIDSHSDQALTVDLRDNYRAIRLASPERFKSVLFGVVHTLLCSHWSLEQIALALARQYPKGHKLRLSHETIYNCIYTQPMGKLRKELIYDQGKEMALLRQLTINTEMMVTATFERIGDLPLYCRPRVGFLFMEFVNRKDLQC